MFINNETGRPAWLVSHDGDVIYSLGLPGDKSHPHRTVDGSAFFATHREATADEIGAYQAAAKPAAPKAAPKAATKPKAVPKAPKGQRAARKAAPPPPQAASADKAPASDSVPGAGAEASPGGKSGEPHGE